MNRLTNTLYLFFLFYIVLPIQAQEYIFDVEHINVEEGLPDRRVLNILQDKKGFIWVSTPGAISRYDGYHFKSYSSDFLGIRGNTAVKFAVDQQNNLWYREVIYSNKIKVGIIDLEADSLLSIGDYTKGLFTAKDIAAFSTDRLNRAIFYIGTKDGTIYKYDDGFVIISRQEAVLNDVFSCEQAADGSYWLLNDGKVVNISKNKEQSYSIPSYPHRIIRTTPSVLIQTEDFNKQKIEFLNLVDGQFLPYTPESFSEDLYYKLLSSNNGFQGHITKDSLIIQYQSYRASFSNEVINAPCKNCAIKPIAEIVDSQNNFWMATENGIIKISLTKNPFTIIEEGNSLRGIYKTDNQLWIGGYVGNARYDLSSNKVEPFMELPTLAAFSFYKDERDHLWVAGGNSLFEYSADRRQLNVYDVNRGATVLFRNEATDKLFIGTEISLLYFDKKTKTVTQLPSFNNQQIWVRQIYQNEEGIWIVSNNGLFLMDPKTEEIIYHYTIKDGLPTNSINHLYEDEAGIFWLATKNNGLIHWDVEQNIFKQYTTANGLSNNTVYAVYEDGYKNLWLPSNYGLMCFNKQTLSTKVYLPKHGIAHEEFNTYSHFQAADSTLYFGGLNGLTRFHPKDIFQENDALPLYVTEVNVLTSDSERFNNQTEDFKTSQSITLQPNDRILEVSFSLLDYGESSINQYAYKIEGYQDQWVYTKENKIALINMPYGTYNLVIKGRSSTGDWSSSQLNIPLEVQTPFYKKPWFIGWIIFLGSISLIGLVKWRIRKLEKDKNLLEGEVQKRTHELEKDKQIITQQAEALKQLDKTKTRFFSNITHEFRTPLTLIIGPTEQLLKDPAQGNQKKLRGVLKNARQLLGLINQLLDLSKLESGGMKIELFRGDVVAYTQDLIDRLQPMALMKEQRLSILYNQEEWDTYFDKDKWDKIVYNLVSNAIKFTPKGGAIQISLLKEQENSKDWLRLEIKDSGLGIEEAQLSRIFNRFYQADNTTTREQEGTGIGLSLVKELVEVQQGEIWVISKIGKGTSFMLKIPIPDLISSEVAVGSNLQSQLIIPPITELEPLSNDAIVSPIESTSERLRILIIEDNQDMRDYIRSCINEEVYDILEAGDGEIGIERAIATIPDLIVSDVMMPKKDGFEVTQTIRTTLSTSHIPIVLLTAKASLESRLEGLKRGADAYLNKPFSPEELIIRISKLIELRQLLQLRYTNQLSESNQKVEEQFASEDAFFQELRAYILENITGTLNGDIIGKEFGMSRMQLHRKIKALTNQSTSVLVKNIRLEKGLQLLKEKDLNISEIAYETGFSSPNYFSKIFKEKFGKAPSEI